MKPLILLLVFVVLDSLLALVAGLSIVVVADVKRLDRRVDFITTNMDPAAISSLSEFVTQFSQNGANNASRLTYLEGIIASLVNKSQ